MASGHLEKKMSVEKSTERRLEHLSSLVVEAALEKDGKALVRLLKAFRAIEPSKADLQKTGVQFILKDTQFWGEDGEIGKVLRLSVLASWKKSVEKSKGDIYSLYASKYTNLKKDIRNYI